MKHRVQTIRNCVSVAILAASLASAVPVRAQIASYIDEHGKLIFVNGDSPKPLRGSTISNAHPVNLAAPLSSWRRQHHRIGWIASFAKQPSGIKWTRRW